MFNNSCFRLAWISSVDGIELIGRGLSFGARGQISSSFSPEFSDIYKEPTLYNNPEDGEADPPEQLISDLGRQSLFNLIILTCLLSSSLTYLLLVAVFLFVLVSISLFTLIKPIDAS